MSVNHFDVLKAMSAANGPIYLAPLDNISNVRKVKAGTLVTIGIGGDFIGGIASGRYVGGLILAEKVQFNETKERLSQNPTRALAQSSEAESATGAESGGGSGPLGNATEESPTTAVAGSGVTAGETALVTALRKTLAAANELHAQGIGCPDCPPDSEDTGADCPMLVAAETALAKAASK